MFHAVHEVGVPLKVVAGLTGKKLGVEVKRLSEDEGAAHFGFLAHIAAVDIPVSSGRTRAVLGWEPAQVGLLEDLEAGLYF